MQDIYSGVLLYTTQEKKKKKLRKSEKHHCKQHFHFLCSIGMDIRQWTCDIRFQIAKQFCKESYSDTADNGKDRVKRRKTVIKKWKRLSFWDYALSRGV